MESELQLYLLRTSDLFSSGKKHILNISLDSIDEYKYETRAGQNVMGCFVNSLYIPKYSTISTLVGSI